ncbi:MAG: WD40 repeat domain-containing protein [Planctomycetes bacterium]|nr:WD40 repeat domain-containing protein [Planctomycetota bacterium]
MQTENPAIDAKLVHVAEQWPHDHPLISCRFDPTGRFLFACSEDSTIQRWELAGKTRTPFAGHASWPRDVAFTPSGETMISCGYDDSLIWWETASPEPKPVRVVKAHERWIDGVAVSPDGRFVASAGSDRAVRLWNIADGSPIREFTGHAKHVYSLLFHPSGEFLLSGDLGGQVHQWEIATGKCARTIDATGLWSYNGGQAVDYGGVRSMAWNADATQLVCSGLREASNPLGAVNDPFILRFSWDKGEKLRGHVVADVKGVAWNAAFHPLGFLVACSGGSGGGWLLFWNADDDQAFHKFQLPNTARGMSLHPDGIQVATAHHDRHARISRLVAKPA